MKCVDDRRCFVLPYALPYIRFQLARLSLNFVQSCDGVQRFFGYLALVGRVQIEELAARMRHAADFRNAQLKACLVAREVIADQFAVPVAEEVSSMFACTARAEVVNDRSQIGELTGGISAPWRVLKHRDNSACTDALPR
ncbi:hypothetical protein D3C86_869520 [compost metagenome]